MEGQGSDRSYNAQIPGQAQMRRGDISNMSNQDQSNFIQETGTQVKNMAQGAADVGKGAAQAALNLARGAAVGAANMAQGTGEVIKNTLGVNSRDTPGGGDSTKTHGHFGDNMDFSGNRDFTTNRGGGGRSGGINTGTNFTDFSGNWDTTTGGGSATNKTGVDFGGDPTYTDFSGHRDTAGGGRNRDAEMGFGDTTFPGNAGSMNDSTYPTNTKKY